MAVNKELQAAAKAGVGDTVKVTMEPDTAPRRVTVPAWLRKALKTAGQDETFNALSYSHKKELVDWLCDAKKPATHARRIEKCVAMLAKRNPPKR
jgi:uncharacterized protein YdeI (YjbR/CyaY-like superfamily)